MRGDSGFSMYYIKWDLYAGNDLYRFQHRINNRLLFGLSKIGMHR